MNGSGKCLAIVGIIVSAIVMIAMVAVILYFTVFREMLL